MAKHSIGDALGRVNYRSFASAIDAGGLRLTFTMDMGCVYLPCRSAVGTLVLLVFGSVLTRAAWRAAFTPVGLETAPSSAGVGFGFTPAVVLAPLTAAEEAVADKAVGTISEFILTRKVLVRPAFEDHEANQVSACHSLIQ